MSSIALLFSHSQLSWCHSSVGLYPSLIYLKIEAKVASESSNWFRNITNYGIPFVGWIKVESIAFDTISFQRLCGKSLLTFTH